LYEKTPALVLPVAENAPQIATTEQEQPRHTFHKVLVDQLMYLRMAFQVAVKEVLTDKAGDAV
jgi:hypothetical protein